MWRRLWWLSALGLVALRCGGGSGDDTGTGGSGGTAGVSTCGAAMTACSSDSQCCDRCDPMTHVCTTNLPTPNTCIQAGSACGSSTACCSLACDNGTCKDKCVGDNDACTSSGACCSGKCADGKCAQINLACKTAGNACGSSGECCSKACTNGTCALSVSWCIQNGDICANPDDCCGGMCNATEGGTLGTCAQPVVGGTYCSSGIDGTVCSGCNECCSRLCAPYGPTGVKVCQPASGCHVNGDLCRKNSDCCGGEGSGLPGDGNVTCVLMEGTSIGICRNPTGCNPEGNVCHYQDYACSISSARNDCCAAVGNSGVCQIDALGVPRCYGLGADCRMPGETCASQADCCNSVPCIPDSTGKLICATPPDAGPVCRNPGESCTIDGDCCPGFLCVKLPGATTGTCGTPPSTPDAGSCALYGQACTTGAACCSGITCLGPNNTACGGTGCTCYNLIPK